MTVARASILFSTNSAIAFKGLFCERAMMVMTFQLSPILSLPPARLPDPFFAEDTLPIGTVVHETRPADNTRPIARAEGGKTRRVVDKRQV